MVDKITVENLKSYKDSLKESLYDHFQNGAWMHPDDVEHAKEMINALEFVLKDFGE
jgi:hypothetical protein